MPLAGIHFKAFIGAQDFFETLIQVSAYPRRLSYMLLAGIYFEYFIGAQGFLTLIQASAYPHRRSCILLAGIHFKFFIGAQGFLNAHTSLSLYTVFPACF